MVAIEPAMQRMTTQGALHDTYVAALQHDLVDLPPEAALVGVVRRPTGWFQSTVDENYPALGPPDSLLDEFKERHETLEDQGMGDAAAHDAAWDEVEFAERYRTHLTESEAAREAVDELLARLREGESLVLVCFENTDKKRCHRTVLMEHLRDRL